MAIDLRFILAVIKINGDLEAHRRPVDEHCAPHQGDSHCGKTWSCRWIFAAMAILPHR